MGEVIDFYKSLDIIKNKCKMRTISDIIRQKEISVEAENKLKNQLVSDANKFCLMLGKWKKYQLAIGEYTN